MLSMHQFLNRRKSFHTPQWYALVVWALMTFILTALSLRESLWAIYLRAMASTQKVVMAQ